MSEFIRAIECQCGNWEEMVADDQRAKSQSFECVKFLDDGEAIYQCNCGLNTKSYTSENQSEKIPESFYGSTFVAQRIEKGAICFVAKNKANQQLSFVIDMNHGGILKEFDFTIDTTIEEILDCNIECVKLH